MEKEVAEPVKLFSQSYASIAGLVENLKNQPKELQGRFDQLAAELEKTGLALRQSLAEQEALSLFLDNILETVKTGIIAVDKAGVITLFNKEAERIFGLSAEEVLGRKYEKFFPVPISVMETLAIGKAFAGREKHLTPLAGGKTPLGVSTALLYDGEGNLSGALEVLTDLSAHKALEEELAQTKTMAALGEMAALVAHEVRNPLVGISGFAGLLKRELKEPAHLKSVSKILDGAAELERLVSTLLNYTKQLDLTQELLDLKDLVESAVQEVGQPLEKELREHRFMVRGDGQYLKIAVRNLVENALQAAGQGGKVRISLLSGKRGQSARISVSDNGPGIHPEMQKKIFTPFFTTRLEGSGLGLAIVKKIIEAHRGKVWVESLPQKGSTFYIELPLWS